MHSRLLAAFVGLNETTICFTTLGCKGIILFKQLLLDGTVPRLACHPATKTFEFSTLRLSFMYCILGDLATESFTAALVCLALHAFSAIRCTIDTIWAGDFCFCFTNGIPLRVLKLRCSANSLRQ